MNASEECSNCTSDSQWQWHAVSMFLYLMLIVVILLGNVLVILAFFKDAALRAITNYWIVSLAMTDIVLACTVLPLQTVREAQQGQWRYGQIVCDLFIFSDVLCCTCSIYHMALISLDRYFCVRFPIKYKAVRTVNRTMYAISATWVWCMLISMPRLVGWKENSSSDECTIVSKSYLIFSSVVSFYLPLTFIICMYIGVYKIAKQRNRRRWDRELAHSIRMRECLINSAQPCLSITDHTSAVKRSATGISGAGSDSTSRSTIDHQIDRVELPNKSPVEEVEEESIIMLAEKDYSNVGAHAHFKQPCCGTSSISIADERAYPRLSFMLKAWPFTSERTLHKEPVFKSSLSMRSVIDGESGRRRSRDATDSMIGRGYSLLRLAVPGPIRLQASSRTVSSNKLRKRMQRQEQKAGRVVLIVLGAFVILWSPFFIVNLLEPLCAAHCNIAPVVFQWVTWLGYVNSAVNPFIYTFFNRTFREAIICVLTCKRIRRTGSGALRRQR